MAVIGIRHWTPDQIINECKWVINNISRGRIQAYYEFVNMRGAEVMVCPKCHQKVLRPSHMILLRFCVVDMQHPLFPHIQEHYWCNELALAAERAVQRDCRLSDIDHDQDLMTCVESLVRTRADCTHMIVFGNNIEYYYDDDEAEERLEELLLHGIEAEKIDKTMHRRFRNREYRNLEIDQPAF